MHVVLSKPRNLHADDSQAFAEHREAFSQIVSVLMAANLEFSVYEHRPGRNLPRASNDTLRYMYHAEVPGPGDYCLKRGPLPFLWYFDPRGYSGWSAIAQDTELQSKSLSFDPVAAKAILSEFQDKLRSTTFSLIPQPLAKLEPEVAALEDYVFYPLQVNNDAVLKLSDCPQYELIQKAGAHAERLGRHLVFKRHPLCKSDTVLSAISAVINSDYVHVSTGPTTELIEGASAVMLTNSSVGLQALVLNVPVFTFGASEYAHLTTRLSSPEDTVRVFEDCPAPPQSTFAGGIAYLLSEYFVDIRDPKQIEARINTHIEECQSLQADASSSIHSDAHLRQLTLDRAMARESTELLDFVLMTYGSLKGDNKVTIARMLSRLARSGLFTERIIQQTDSDVSNRCLRYLEQSGDTDGLITVAQARVKKDPGDWRAFSALARSYRARGDEEAGLEAAKRAANSPNAPHSVQLYFARTLWSQRADPNKTVRKIVLDILCEDPKNAVANWLQARICLTDGEIGSAKHHIEAALTVQPADPRYLALKSKLDALEDTACQDTG